MNKMYTIAKIAAGILGIYLLIRLTLTLMQSISILFAGPSAANTSFFVVITVSLLTIVVFGGAVFYFLIYRSDIFARKIVGRCEDLPDPSRPSAWYPFALRLAVMIAGFIFLLNAITLSSSLAHSIRFMSQLDTPGGMWQIYESIIYLLIYLAISIYLLCGAPHFVRWQVKKTAQLCREFSEKQNEF